ncbi:hypothetical protein [Yinghuangia soli]|uniref:Nucleotidyltransferase domain-containing protein n=1 Tax=Yinghuangia soli TaxID=2908204 RepID=A0AA41Q4C4_9ACTN|nr:hypothetical protein [Yinghuangia soli]MCF2530750.1 hypothetical protein [Yinghuangia soli]
MTTSPVSPVPLTYEAFVTRAVADPAVVGIVLKGSHAHDGMAGPHSDHDVYAILADSDPAPAWSGGLRSPALDLVVVTLAEFRALGMPGFERYALARARVVLDRLDGEISRIVAAKAQLDADEATTASASWLDAYANAHYRSLKNARDGLPLAARLDAVDSIGFLLELLFAMDRRPRPYNKYLEWELARYPLPDWDTPALTAALTRIATTCDPTDQRALFAQVEPRARKAGHAAVLDAWGEDLHLMRPPATAP